MTLRHTKLHGFPSALPPTTKDGLKWEAMKGWEDALEKLYVKIPRNIKGIDKVADVDTVLCSILPWRVSNSDILHSRREASTASSEIFLYGDISYGILDRNKSWNYRNNANANYRWHNRV